MSAKEKTVADRALAVCSQFSLPLARRRKGVRLEDRLQSSRQYPHARALCVGRHEDNGCAHDRFYSQFLRLLLYTTVGPMHLSSRARREHLGAEYSRNKLRVDCRAK